jgi:hypothetical protein
MIKDFSIGQGAAIFNIGINRFIIAKQITVFSVRDVGRMKDVRTIEKLGAESEMEAEGIGACHDNPFIFNSRVPIRQDAARIHKKLHSAAVAGGTNRNENKGATLLYMLQLP